MSSSSVIRLSAIVLIVLSSCHLIMSFPEDRHRMVSDDERPPNEAPATNHPVFISKGSNFTAHVGDTIELTCDVKELDPFVLIWRKGTTNLIYAGTLRVTRDDRITMEQPKHRLIFRKVNVSDSGEYVCAISTTPPIELSYHINIIELPPGEKHTPGRKDHTHRNAGESIMMTSSSSLLLSLAASIFFYLTSSGVIRTSSPIS